MTAAAQQPAALDRRRRYRERASDAPLVAVARGGAPLRRVLARLAGELVRRRAWEPLGFARLADYGRERLGISGRELQELARVDARLAELPRAEAAFVAARITWSRLRLVCRVATPGDEAAWLELAARTSAARLAREVRATERGCVEAGALAGETTDETGAVEERLERVAVPCGPRVRMRWGEACRLARQVAGGRLRPADVAELVAAEVVAGLGLEAQPDEPSVAARLGAAGRQVSCAGDPGDTGDSAALPWPAEAPAPDAHPARFLASLVDGLDAASPAELDARLRRAVGLERRLLARLGPLLLELAASRGYQELGLRSLDQYARERLGMAPRTARALLRLERTCLASPALGRAWRSGALAWSKAQVLAGLFALEHTRPWQDAWLARARAVTVRRLEDDVEHVLATGDADPAALPPLPEAAPGAACSPRPAGVQIGAASRVVFAAHPDVARLFRAALATVRLRLERATGRPAAPGDALEAMLEHAREAWLPPPRRRRAQRDREDAVFERDGWRCVIPGCSSRRNLHAHHIRFRSAGGGDEPANLTTLCAAHHQRGVHGGRIRIAGRAPEALAFELPTGRYRAGDVRAAGRRVC